MSEISETGPLGNPPEKSVGSEYTAAMFALSTFTKKDVSGVKGFSDLTPFTTNVANALQEFLHASGSREGKQNVAVGLIRDQGNIAEGTLPDGDTVKLVIVDDDSFMISKERPGSNVLLYDIGFPVDGKFSDTQDPYSAFVLKQTDQGLVEEEYIPEHAPDDPGVQHRYLSALQTGIKDLLDVVQAPDSVIEDFEKDYSGENS